MSKEEALDYVSSLLARDTGNSMQIIADNPSKGVNMSTLIIVLVVAAVVLYVSTLFMVGL